MELDKDFEVLPVVDLKDDLIQAIKNNQIIICIGETGSGKTTQIPQFCADSGLLCGKSLVVTQPRRVAAITVAERVAQERNCKLGAEVGYTIRFDDHSGPSTKIRFVTDGVLVRTCLSDPLLSEYQVVMLDEAHERSINTDILFGLTKRACKHRPDLKLIITSATLDLEKFQMYFNNCPVVYVPGRVFPVDLYHSKMRQIMTTSGPSSNAYIEAAADIVMEIHRQEEDGHILVFLTGQEEIERTCALIRNAYEELVAEGDAGSMSMLVLPLYAALSSDAQHLIFKRVEKNVRKVVVATNIAETSVTVPHVRYVVDVGYVKQKVYDPERHMESLVVVPISQVSAEQRAGRAGRTAPGKCYRLYSSDCLGAMTRETIPEIQRSNLANVILQLKALDIHDVIGFDFLDPPATELICEALVSLHMLGGLDNHGALTETGRLMTSFSVEPILSRMIIEAVRVSGGDREPQLVEEKEPYHREKRPKNAEASRKTSDFDPANALDDAIIVAAMMSVEEIWITRPSGRSGRRQPVGNARSNDRNADREERDDLQKRAEAAHMVLRHPLGDYHTNLGIYRSFVEAGCSQEWAFDNFLRYRSLRMATQIRSQLWDEAVSGGVMSMSMKPLDCHPPSSSSRSSDTQGRPARLWSGGRRRDIALCKSIATALFMNAARRCTNESIFRTLPLVDTGGFDHERQEVRLLHLHGSCTLNTSRDLKVHVPPEMVLYQDIVVGSKPLMRHVMVADLVADEVNSRRESWKYISPLALSGREEIKSEKGQGLPDANPAVGKKRSSDTQGAGDDCRELSKTDVVLSAKERYLARKKFQGK